jgi:hypothetical protein
LHLNLSGTEKVAKLIGESIKQLIARERAPPVISKRREETTNHHQKEAVDNPTNDDIKGTTPESPISPMKHGETQAQIRTPLPTTSTDQNNEPPRTNETNNPVTEEQSPNRVLNCNRRLPIILPIYIIGYL